MTVTTPRPRPALSSSGPSPSPVPVPVRAAGESVADWTAGYEAGWAAGRHAARTVLDDAATHVARWRPSRAVDTVQARRARTRTGRRPGEPDHDDPTALAAYRARIYTSWGLTPPPSPPQKPSQEKP